MYVLIVHAETRGKREEESFVLHRGLLEVSQPVHVRRYRQGSPQPCPELYAVYKLSFRTGSSSLSVTASFIGRREVSLTASVDEVGGAIRIGHHVPRTALSASRFVVVDAYRSSACYIPRRRTSLTFFFFYNTHYLLLSLLSLFRAFNLVQSKEESCESKTSSVIQALHV